MEVAILQQVVVIWRKQVDSRVQVVMRWRKQVDSRVQVVVRWRKRVASPAPVVIPQVAVQVFRAPAGRVSRLSENHQPWWKLDRAL